MKFFLAIALIATVASAAIIKPTPVSAEAAQIQEIIAAIHSPSTDPATAAALEAMLFDILGLTPEPIAVGPAIVEPVPAIDLAQIQEIIAAIHSPSTHPATAAALEAMLFDILGLTPEPIAVGPAIVEPEHPISVGPAIVEPSPVIIGDIPEGSPAPLVQIIVNVNKGDSVAVGAAPAILPEIVPTPVQVIEPASPVQVVEPATPVQVVETAPVAPEPVIIGTPQLPSPAVILPDELN